MRGPALRIASVITVLSAALFTGAAQVAAAETGTVYPLVFPVGGANSWTDTYGAPRSEGRTHQGIDIFAAKGTPVLAAADGRVSRIAEGNRAGRFIVISHDDGWSTYYLHLDNDTPGTDDGLGGAPAPGIQVGTRVAAGDVIDFVGDSGNAEGTSPHLHFELHRPDGRPVNPTPHLNAAESGSAPESLSGPDRVLYRAAGVELVGSLDPGGGFAAGLAVHNDIAYVGTWGRHDACPNSGVRVIDVSDPTEPVAIGVIAGSDEYPGTSTDGVWAGRVETDSFVGALAVVSVRLCDTSERNRKTDAFRGLAIYDVNEPAAPRLLSEYHSGAQTQGANDVSLAVRPDGRAVLSATVMQSYLHTGGRAGDWRLVDVSDPEHPRQVAEWDYRSYLPAGDRARSNRELHVHTSLLSASGEQVWLGVWDAGLIQLDLRNPEAPKFISSVPVGEGHGGNAHGVAFDPASGLLIRNDENLEWLTEDGEIQPWGGQTFYDASDPADVELIGSFTTANTDLTAGVPAAPGYFTAHEAVLVNNIEYVSWYSDGIRIVDLSDAGAPTEIGHFVPPPTPDPQAHFLGQGRGSSFAMVWGVVVTNGYIYLTDMHSGLWIVRHAGPESAPRVTGRR